MSCIDHHKLTDRCRWESIASTARAWTPGSSALSPSVTPSLAPRSQVQQQEQHQTRPLPRQPPAGEHYSVFTAANN